MKAPMNFVSRLAEAMVRFVAFKRMQGYDYTASAECLRQFDTFVSNSECTQRGIEARELERYRFQIRGLKPATQRGRLSVVRQFSLHLRAFAPTSAVLPRDLIRRQPRAIRFRPLDADQVVALMAATVTLQATNEIREHCIRFLIGLLYCTGLRISEALALNLGDVDLDRAMLFVRRGKFCKERLVPMSPSLMVAMDQWLKLRSAFAGLHPSAPLFLAGWNNRLNRYQASKAFARLRIYCGFDDEPPPRLHDLRHNYACACIARWRETGEDVNALLPVLSNAMGHVDVHATEVYIHINAASLQQASAKFHHYATSLSEHSK